MIDRNDIVNDIKSSYYDYSSSDAKRTVEKVMKYSGTNFDLRRHGDIKTEAVLFRLLNAQAIVNVEDEKPYELEQRFQAMVYVEQSDSISGREAAYDRVLELSDQLIRWADATSACDISNQMWTLTFTGSDTPDEEDGYLSANVNFKSIIKIR